MANVWFTADLHLGHKNIGRFREPIPEENAVAENNAFISANWKAKPRDTIYLLGDVLFDKESIYFLKGLPGRKILVMGNHDFESGAELQELLDAEVVERVLAVYIKSFKGKGSFMMTHVPVHPQEIRGDYNMHGHVHDHAQCISDKRYVNVNLDVLWHRTGAIMINLEELSNYIKFPVAKKPK